VERLILWPGLAADERMYRRLGETGWQMETPRFPLPERGETLPALALRCAALLEVGPRDVVGGCSFGGMVAAEIARQRPVRALVLLAGALDSGTLPASVRGLGFLPRLLPLGWLRRFFASEFNLRRFFGEQDPEGYALAREMLADTPDALLRDGGRMAVSQWGRPAPAVPVFALHGAEDRVMGPPPVARLQVVAGAGHGLVFSHAGRVSDFLRDLKGGLG